MTNNEYFKYDGIILIDEDIDQYIDELKVLISNNSTKHLIILLDDRNYELKEKNIIKHYSDNLSLDILMFTLNPEYLNIINKKFKNFKILRNIFRLNWILVCLEKYNIKNVYLNIDIIKNLNFVYKDNLNLLYTLKKIINNKIHSLKRKNNKNISNSTFLKLINFLDPNKIADKNFFF